MVVRHVPRRERPIKRRVRSLVGATTLAVASVVAVTLPDAPAGAGTDYASLGSSVRLVDTRPGATTSDGMGAGIGLRAAGSTLDVQVAGRGAVPLDASVAVLTVAAVDPLGDAFLTVHPTGTSRPNASNVNYNAGHNSANTVLARLGTDGKVSIYTFAATHLVVDVTGYFPTGSATSLGSSVRLVDTRPGATTSDGMGAGIGLRAAGSTLDVQVAGRGAVPLDASTAVLTVAAVDPLGDAFLTVHPTGTSRPNASNVNYNAGHNSANTVLARLGTDGKVSIYTFAATHLVVDVTGHLPADVYHPLLQPRRLADTRPGAPTFDGENEGTGVVYGGHSLQVHVAGRAGVPVDASTAVLTVAAVDPQADSYLTVHPVGTARPNASHVNYNRDHNRANTVLARIGAGGDVCIYSDAATHLVVDVAGYLPGPAPAAAGPDCAQPEQIVYWRGFDAVGRSGLWLMDADGTDHRPLVTSLAVHGGANWSPDGTMLAFTASDPSLPPPMNGEIDVWVIGADGSGLHNVTGADDAGFRTPSWSPDGTQFALVIDSGLWIMNTDGSGRRPVLVDGNLREGVDWSPDGSLLLYHESPVVDGLLTGKSRIWTIRPDGTGATALTEPGNLDSANWSPDGSQIAFVAYDSGPGIDDHADVWVMDADGSDQRNITDNPNRYDRSPDWSADGTRIVFDSEGPGVPFIIPPGEIDCCVPDPPADIYVIPVGGGPATQLTFGDQFDQSPSWQPIGAP